MRIFSLQGDHLKLECAGHTHNWENGYIDVDTKTGKHIMDTFVETGNVGLEPASLNFSQWPETGKPPELKSTREESTPEVKEESVEETN